MARQENDTAELNVQQRYAYNSPVPGPERALTTTLLRKQTKVQKAQDSQALEVDPALNHNKCKQPFKIQVSTQDHI
jgi:hypothetical protein